MKYPIYIPSKGRAEIAQTPMFLRDADIPFRLVVEPDEYEAYMTLYGADYVLQLPKSGQGLSYSRNFCKKHATVSGAKRHWQIDDNVKGIYRMNKGKGIKTDTASAMTLLEEFVDRYSNVGLAGLRHQAFVRFATKPFEINQQVYSFYMILNEMPFNFRDHLIEDTDMNLQVITGGWCTILFNAYYMMKTASQTMSGGNTDSEYIGDGTWKRAKRLQLFWQDYVKGIKYNGNKYVCDMGRTWSDFGKLGYLKKSCPFLFDDEEFGSVRCEEVVKPNEDFCFNHKI